MARAAGRLVPRGVSITQPQYRKLSVLIPCYNERGTLATIVQQVRAVDTGLETEIIVVDDGSTDGSREILQKLADDGLVRAAFQPKNAGKGAAVQRALQEATGDILLVQDADLEYDPADYPLLLRPILTGRAKVVYGSRFLGEHRAMYFWHSLGNKLLTLVTNVLYDTTLTDMETCYKVMTADIAQQIQLRSPRWGFDPEITARILRTGNRIYEVPISYAGREYEEGKKISWRDGLVVLITLIRCRFLP
ncbi:MAG TPA: glycosyltransferase family 2 protein [Chloroflexota bacterium]|nr:glycosyltransferase family 2 protein [Chloroflexota bacterium]